MNRLTSFIGGIAALILSIATASAGVATTIVQFFSHRVPFVARFVSFLSPNPVFPEYMAIGVVNDEKIGQMSEIKEVVYAG